MPSRRIVPAAVLLGLFVLGMAGAAFVVNARRLTAEIEATFHTRSELLAKFVVLRRDQVTVMRNLLLGDYARQQVPDAAALRVIQHPDKNLWEVDPTGDRVAGRATGSGPLDPETLRELDGAFAMAPQIEATLQLNQEVIWLYYVSSRNFIFIAPGVGVEQFHFTPELYERGYWKLALPEADPERKMILQGPVEDLAGKGRILTFSQPVYDQDRFLGVVAMDLGLGTMRKLMTFGSAVGETVMFTGGHELITQSDTEIVTWPEPPVTLGLLDWREDQNGDLWLSSSAVDRELWLLHRVRRGELFWATVRESAPEWVLLALLTVLASISWRLRIALAAMRQVVRVDPLTRTLNRRGFYESTEGVLSVARRKTLCPVVLIMDIDHFKKINDSHGHGVGDSVLRDVGKHLLAALRPSDLVCRWGGEEFVVVLVVDRADQALAAAERLRHEAQRARIASDHGTVTLSGGLVIIGGDEAIDAAIKRADALLYDAKRRGRNQIVSDLASSRTPLPAEA